MYLFILSCGSVRLKLFIANFQRLFFRVSKYYTNITSCMNFNYDHVISTIEVGLPWIIVEKDKASNNRTWSTAYDES